MCFLFSSPEGAVRSTSPTLVCTHVHVHCTQAHVYYSCIHLTLINVFKKYCPNSKQYLQFVYVVYEEQLISWLPRVCSHVYMYMYVLYGKCVQYVFLLLLFNLASFALRRTQTGRSQDPHHYLLVSLQSRVLSTQQTAYTMYMYTYSTARLKQWQPDKA